MHTRTLHVPTFAVLTMVVLIFTARSLECHAWDDATEEVWQATTGDCPIIKRRAAYPNPLGDYSWSAAYSGVSDIQTAFNNARANENSQLGTSISALTMPSQSEWDAKSDGGKALWLINRERQDRGIAPLHGVESNVTSVAQGYADFLLANNAFSHYADGHDPWWRLNQNSAIGACHDSLAVAENLAVFWTSGTSIPLPIEQAVYMWMYEDSGSSWGHRYCNLFEPYNDNSGPSGREGFLGLGRASGPHQGWNHAELMVMNVFDPCPSWIYAAEPTPTPPVVPGSNYVNLAVYPTIVSGGQGVTLSYTCLANLYDYQGVPVDVYVAAIKAAQIIDAPSTVGQALGGGTVYLFGPGMSSVYVYEGIVGAPTFRAIAISQASLNGSLLIRTPSTSGFTGTYVFAAAFIRRDNGQFVRTDLPVENSNGFTLH